MNFKITYLILLIGLSYLTKADEVDKILQTDSLVIEATTSYIRYFDGEKLNQYKVRNEFQYANNEERQNRFREYLKNLFAKFMKWLFSFFTEAAYNKEIGGIIYQVLKYLFWGVFTVFLIYGVLKLLGLDFASLFYKTADVKPSIQFTNIEEDIHEIDFSKDIEETVTNKNYRYAIRLYYLKTLKLLSDKELIKWQKDKTNSDYVFEVTKTKFSDDFKDITKLFNYSWYGEVLFNAGTFGIAQQNFITFFDKLNLYNA